MSILMLKGTRLYLLKTWTVAPTRSSSKGSGSDEGGRGDEPNRQQIAIASTSTDSEAVSSCFWSDSSHNHRAHSYVRGEGTF